MQINDTTDSWAAVPAQTEHKIVTHSSFLPLSESVVPFTLCPVHISSIFAFVWNSAATKSRFISKLMENNLKKLATILITDLLFQSLLKQKCQTFSRICCFSLSLETVNEESLGSEMLVKQKKQFEDLKVELWEFTMSPFLLTFYRLKE